MWLKENVFNYKNIKDNMEYQKLIFVMLLICLVPSIYSLDNVAKVGEDYDIRLTITANGSISSVDVNITVNDPDGIVIVDFQKMQKNTATQDFNYTINGTNLTKAGIYDCTAYAFSTITDNQIFSCSFEANPSGKEYIPEISSSLIFGAILSLMFISVFLFLISYKIELFPAKVFMILLAGLISLLNLGFITASFQEFFSIESGLSSSFGVVYTTFTILVGVGSIFLIIWALITGLKLYKIKRGFFVNE